MNRTDGSVAGVPTLSVVIPVYNDPEGIRTTLESLTAQTYPIEAYEVFVVDNGSDDDTREVVREYCDRYPDLVTLLVEDKIQSSYAARNRGVEHAGGSLVSFVDADMSVESTWAESVVASHEEHEWDYMGCEIVVYADGDESLAVLFERHFSAFPVKRYLEERHFTVTACLTVRKEIFEDIGRFDARLISGGDMEFGKRVHAAGFDQYLEAGITMYHPARTTLRALLTKRVRIGRGTAQLAHYRPERFTTRSFLNPRRYLPPHPVRVREKIVGGSSLRPSETFAIFAIVYLYKLFGSIGEFSEYVEHRAREWSGRTFDTGT
jgi:glycosyltransferase involved in cell wall biosynthesis